MRAHVLGSSTVSPTPGPDRRHDRRSAQADAAQPHVSRNAGLFAIAALLALFTGLFLGFSPAPPRPVIVAVDLLGGAAFLLMSVSMILSARIPVLEELFGGLDRIYRVHKFAGLTAAVTVIVHFLVQPNGMDLLVDGGAEALRPAAPLGMASMILLILGSLVALNRKIRYSLWRPTHRIMPLVYSLVTIHLLTMPTELFDRATPAGLLLVAVAAAGLSSGLYAIFAMNAVTARPFTVENVVHHEKVTELVLTPDREALAFRSGQFAFVELEQYGWNEVHPFTIASAPGDDRVRFAIKALGDWTGRLGAELKPGGKAILRGPYGRFDTTRAQARQVWVAGGIGVTPFLSNLRAMTPDDRREIHMFYALRTAEDAVFLDEISARAAQLPNLTLTVLYSEQGQRATFDTITATLDGPATGRAWFMCGPKPMTAALAKALRAHGVRGRDIHAEAFEFR